MDKTPATLPGVRLKEIVGNTDDLASVSAATCVLSVWVLAECRVRITDLQVAILRIKYYTLLQEQKGNEYTSEENLYLKENSFTVICLDVGPRLGDQYSDVLDVSKILHGWIESGATVGYPGLCGKNVTLRH